MKNLLKMIIKNKDSYVRRVNSLKITKMISLAMKKIALLMNL